MQNITNQELRNVHGGGDPCRYDAPSGFINGIDYLIGWTFAKVQIVISS